MVVGRAVAAKCGALRPWCTGGLGSGGGEAFGRRIDGGAFGRDTTGIGFQMSMAQEAFYPRKPLNGQAFIRGIPQHRG